MRQRRREGASARIWVCSTYFRKASRRAGKAFVYKPSSRSGVDGVERISSKKNTQRRMEHLLQPERRFAHFSDATAEIRIVFSH